MKTRREARAQLRQFVALCRGQKAAALILGVSPQYVGQLYHGDRPVPAVITHCIEQRLLYGNSAPLADYRRRLADTPAV